ncbi:lytic transglycosylase domain-containing protein [Desulfurobacterium sp. TC5-1]|uniref:lytic transglycosylase domain-containing protein n=1 Tax=Desulfurobacterium sp. TC5-1 TaxID=1158318 RepID=UPI0003B5E2FF|nr:lytic transglycosylase domain-containing protein [Desulfurobacterium sp. TC5-1]
MILIFSIYLPLSPSFSASMVCFGKAAEYYGLPASLLVAIAEVESGLNPGAVRLNRNGSKDIGIMQINSSWIPVLKKYGIGEMDLYDPCTNVFVGAWILKQCFVRYGWTWKAVGCYHSGDPDRQLKYARKVYKQIYKEKKR